MFNVGQILFFATQEKILPFVIIEKQIKESLEGTTFKHKCLLLQNKSSQAGEETFYLEELQKKLSTKNVFFICESLEEASQNQIAHYSAFVDRQKREALERVTHYKSLINNTSKQNNEQFEMNSAVISSNDMMKLPDGSFAKVNIIQ